MSAYVGEDSKEIQLKLNEIESYEKTLKARRKLVLGLLGVGMAIGVLVPTWMYGSARLHPTEFETYVLVFATACMVALAIVQTVFSIRERSVEQERELLIGQMRIVEIATQTPLEDSASPVGYSYFERLVDINLTNLGAYYGMVKNHANNSFSAAIIAGVMGFTLISVGLISGWLGQESQSATTYIAAGSGIITEFIAGVFFYLYNRTVRQLKDYHDSLLMVQNILLSFKIVGDIQDSTHQVEMIREMIAYLVGRQGAYRPVETKTPPTSE